MKNKYPARRRSNVVTDTDNRHVMECTRVIYISLLYCGYIVFFHGVLTTSELRKDVLPFIIHLLEAFKTLLTSTLTRIQITMTLIVNVFDI